VAAGRVHEELQRVERPGRRRSGLGGRNGGADDDVALVEGGAERRDLVLGQVVLVGEGLELAVLDEAALGGLLEQAVGRRQVQVRVSQWNLPLSVDAEPRRSRILGPGRGASPRYAGRPCSLLIERVGEIVHSQTSHSCDFLTTS
jgi:hypothetical protein